MANATPVGQGTETETEETKAPKAPKAPKTEAPKADTPKGKAKVTDLGGGTIREDY
jgi:hypothetical protein